MRVLFLHDEGSNAKTFRSQMTPVLTSLATHDSRTPPLFHFCDGPQPRQSAGSPKPSGYHYWDDKTAESLERAHGWLSDLADTAGPFDGVVACSQACAVVSSFFLYRQWYSPELPLPFRFAVFINGTLPLVALRVIGVLIPDQADRILDEARTRKNKGLGPAQTHVSGARRALFNSDDCFGLNLNRIPQELKIRIPTGHMWGQREPLFPGAIQLAGLCDPYLRWAHDDAGSREDMQTIETGTGTGVGIRTPFLNEMSRMLEWCSHVAVWPGQSG